MLILLFAFRLCIEVKNINVCHSVGREKKLLYHASCLLPMVLEFLNKSQLVPDPANYAAVDSRLRLNFWICNGSSH
uniref:Uncharacterized protein n=1 Tax=Rhizophora mucronata TaxID=61149 RepID=A0A2P2QDN6_RHIMU